MDKRLLEGFYIQKESMLKEHTRHLSVDKPELDQAPAPAHPEDKGGRIDEGFFTSSGANIELLV